MQLSDITVQISKALYLTFILSMPAIGVAALIGILFAIVQALTQIQEQTLSFAVKLVATLVTLGLTLRWIGNEVFQYTQTLFDMISIVGR